MDTKSAAFDLVQQRIVDQLPAFAASLDVFSCIELPIRIALLAGAVLEIVNQRIDIQGGDVRIGRKVVPGIEQSRLGQ
jgi:hypothetical protein